jgi:uncharacterized membrane protein YhaH (DUF805 family)
MLNKNKVMLKAAYLQLRIYMLCVIGFVAAGLLANFIVFLAIGSTEDSTQVSTGNVLTVFIMITAIILPLGFFKKIINLGATRKEYYSGIIVVYIALAAFFSILNIVFLKMEQGFMKDYQHTFNILEIFHWDQFGIAGMFLYQFAVYMLLISLINLMFSGIRSHIGLSLWVILIAAIPISTSIASYRHKLADGLQALLFNESLLEGVGISLVLSCMFFIGGWLFTNRRTF